MEVISLKTPSMQAEISIGEGCLETRLPALTQGQSNFVLTDSNVFALYPSFFERYFSHAEIFVAEAGEQTKQFSTLQAVLEKMVGAGLRRNSRLFAVGGGVIGDLGGLCAALYMRGISCVQIPTTLLSQVDSGVGGKTAIDACGVKNVVGAFYQPCEVLIDPAFLNTLPQREWKCGIGEIVKYAALSPLAFERLNGSVDEAWDEAFWTALIGECVRYKAAVVARDERESGERKSLNIGHTTGHAVELFYGLSHGESVLIGMKLETAIAMAKGVCERAYGEELLRIVDRALALAPQSKIELSRIGEAAERAAMDKKNMGNGITMTVPCAVGKWDLLTLPMEEYRAALLAAVND